jgi:hypothetical protein
LALVAFVDDKQSVCYRRLNLLHVNVSSILVHVTR